MQCRNASLLARDDGNYPDPSFTGWRLRPQVPGWAPNTPGIRVPQFGHPPPALPTGVTRHSLSSYQSRLMVRVAQFGQ
jgi:hypothetical protein